MKRRWPFQRLGLASNRVATMEAQRPSLPEARRFVWTVLFLLAVVATGWTLVAFFRGPFTGLINSDAAVPPLLAAEMLRTRSLVPASWYYVNDDIWLLGPQLYVFPFVVAWGPTARALAAGNLLGLCTTGALVFLLGHRVTRSKPTAALLTLGVLAPFSRIQQDVVFVQLAYGWIFGYLCLLLYLALATMERVASTVRGAFLQSPLWLYSLLLALFFAGSTARGLVYWLAPILGVSLLEARSARVRVQSVALLAASLGAAAAGSACHFLLRVHLHSKAWDAPFRTAGGWGRKLGNAWHGLPFLIGTPPDGNFGWLSAQGSLAAMRVAFLGFAVAALVFIGCREEKPTAMRFGSRLTALMLCSVSVAFVIGRMVSSPLNTRYFLPPILLGLVALLGVCSWRLGRRSPPFLALMALFVTAFVGGGLLRTVDMQPMPSTCAGESRLCEPLAEARAHGLSVGFATYWNANASTLATGGRIRVCPINPDAPLQPKRWLTSRECFLEEQYRSGFFVLLGPPELDGATTQMLVAALGLPTRRETTGGSELWMYEPGPTHDWTWLSR